MTLIIINVLSRGLPGGAASPENRVRPLETCDHRSTNTRLALPKIIFRPLGISNRPSGEKTWIKTLIIIIIHSCFVYYNLRLIGIIHMFYH